MKAKSHFSQLVIDTFARYTLAMFVGITIFMFGFATNVTFPVILYQIHKIF